MTNITLPNAVILNGIPLGVCPPNNIFWVSSATGSSGGGYTRDYPAATINQALALCAADKGDIIYVLPGHTESISGAGAITPVAGVSIVGLGNGAARPKVTLHTTATTIAISAANVTIQNIQILTDVDAVVKVFNVTAAGLTLDAVDFVETASCACLQFVLTSAAADDMTIKNCRWIQTATAATATQEWIKLIGADRAVILNNFAILQGYATGNPANGVVVGGTTASLNVRVENNRFATMNSTGAIGISLYTGSTGQVVGNTVYSAKTAIAGQVACASAFASQNFVANTANASGLLDPVVDS